MQRRAQPPCLKLLPQTVQLDLGLLKVCNEVVSLLGEVEHLVLEPLVGGAKRGDELPVAALLLGD